MFITALVPVCFPVKSLQRLFAQADHVHLSCQTVSVLQRAHVNGITALTCSQPI